MANKKQFSPYLRHFYLASFIICLTILESCSGTHNIASSQLVWAKKDIQKPAPTKAVNQYITENTLSPASEELPTDTKTIIQKEKELPVYVDKNDKAPKNYEKQAFYKSTTLKKETLAKHETPGWVKVKEPTKKEKGNNQATDPVAIISFLCGIAALFTFFAPVMAIPAIIFGIISLHRINGNQFNWRSGRGFAEAGIIMGLAAILIGVIFLIVFVAAA